MVQYQILTQGNELNDSVKVNSEADESTTTLFDASALALSPSPSRSTPLSRSLPKALSTSSSTEEHQEEAQRDSELPRHRSPKIYPDFGSIAKGEKPGHGEEQNAEGGATGMKEMETESSTGHVVTKTEQDTVVTIKNSDTDTTEVRFCSVCPNCEVIA